MSVQSQEKNMRKLADLLSHDLSYIWGEREGGPNGDKERVLLYRTVKHIKDYTGGYNRFLRRRDLEAMSYRDLFSVFMGEAGMPHERAA